MMDAGASGAVAQIILLGVICNYMDLFQYSAVYDLQPQGGIPGNLRWKR
jgi:hypothetical protein